MYSARRVCLTLLLLLQISLMAGPKKIPQWSVYELTLKGKTCTATDAPNRDIELMATWTHEGGRSIEIPGFWDSDGKGGSAGNLFKVRFCPDQPGVWTLTQLKSNDDKLNEQKQGFQLTCTESDRHGFWIVDKENAGGRWYKRSDGSHAYIVGNTVYSFLSETIRNKPTGGNIKEDVTQCAKYFNKIRFAVTGDIYPHPTDKPFLNDTGMPTDNGDFSHRPNPEWFYKRVDLAVQTAYENDIIADIIMNGPDSKDARSALKPENNNEDYYPYLKYMAARYGSYPNVWFCLSNEYNIRDPKFSPEEVVEIGNTLRSLLPCPNPISIHADQGNWNPMINGDWHDHVIFQNKIKKLYTAADYNILNYYIGGQKPACNDELAYEGEGDGWLENDVIEALLGAFMGGGYGSTGYKHPTTKMGHYFAGHFSAEEHLSADNLLWLRQMIDENIEFWKLQPVYITDVTYKKQFHSSRSGIFFQIDDGFRVMAKDKEVYVLATNKHHPDIHALLPEGVWHVTLYDVIVKEKSVISENAGGDFVFESPDSRAAFFHFKRM